MSRKRKVKRAKENKEKEGVKIDRSKCRGSAEMNQG
jgi:hypothetical protein